MEKFKVTYTYPVVVTAYDKDEAIGKAGDVLSSVSELSLKLWMASHSKTEPVIEGNGVNLDNFPL